MSRNPVFVLLAGLVILWGGCSQKKFNQEGPKRTLSHTKSEDKGSHHFYQQVTGSESETSRTKWDQFFNTPNYVYGKDPIPFLAENIGKLRVGRALVIAMGEGKDAVFLARKGFEVEGVDISAVALRKARRLAREYKVNVKTVNAGMRDYRMRENYYDLIVNVTYYRSALIPKIKRALKPGGFVLFENYTVEQRKKQEAISLPPRFLVKKGELKQRFSDFKIVAYQEVDDDAKALASLLAQKPN